MPWIRNTAVAFFAVAVLCWSLLGVAQLRERRAVARCAAQRMQLDFATLDCVTRAAAPERFTKRYSWLVGLTSLASVGAWSYGGWYLLYYKLPRSLDERQGRQTNANGSRHAAGGHSRRKKKR